MQSQLAYIVNAIGTQVLKPQQVANLKMNIGIFAEQTGNVPQIPLFKLGEEKIKKPKVSDENMGEVTRGKNTENNYPEFWLGGAV